MAKYFKINLSPPKKTKIINEPDDKGMMIPKKRKIRELELIVLHNMLRYARRNSKNIDQGFLITDCMDQIDNITDKEEFIRFTAEDIGFLKTGFTAASGTNEINLWFDNCLDLMKQIKNPEEDKPEKNKKGSKKKEPNK